MGAVLQFTARLESTGPCPTCGIEFAMPENLVATKRADRTPFFCPNGHLQSFREGEVERLKKELEQQRQATLRVSKDRDLAWELKEKADDARKEAERSRNGMKGALTKIKAHVGNGVCPCCHRSFTALRRHMATKHPEFKEPEVEVQS